MNLAEILQDGTVVYIPKKERKQQCSRVPEELFKAVEEGELVNINTATLEELQGISGVGPSKAEAIIAYREEMGVSILLKISRRFQE